MASRNPLAALLVAAALSLAACGSQSAAELPAPRFPAGPPAPVADGRYEARIDAQAREVVLTDPATGREVHRVAAGVGPTHVAGRGPWMWVSDTAGDGLLVFRVADGKAPELTRRVYVPGGPGAITVSRDPLRLYVELTSRPGVAELPAHGRPHLLGVLDAVPR